MKLVMKPLPFSEYLWFKSDALEFFQCVKAGTNMWNKMMEEKVGVERQNSKKGFERMSMSALTLQHGGSFHGF